MSNPDYSKLLPNYSSKEETQAGKTAFDWLGSFTKSMLESVPELVGITPSQETMEWRQDNPWGGFGSEMIGMAVPYTGWFKASKSIKAFDAAIEGIGDLNKAPFLTGAAREAARFAPFEAGRVGVSQVVGDQPFGDMLGEAAFNLAIGSGIGGILHGVAAAGTRDPKIEALFPGVDLSLPMPLQIRQMKNMIADGKIGDDLIPQANYRIEELKAKTRAEELPFDEKYVAELESGDKELKKQLERMFRTGKKEEMISRKRFVESSGLVKRDFSTQAEWVQTAKEAGLPESFEDAGQYFRDISFKTGEASERLQQAFKDYNNGDIDYDGYMKKVASLAKNNPAESLASRIDKNLTNKMTSVGDGWFLTKEAEDGLYVMAKKYRGIPGTGSPEDRWVMLKTDNPGAFAVEADRFTKSIISKNAWVPNSKKALDGGEVFNSLSKFQEFFPFKNYAANFRTGRMNELINKALPKGIRGKDNELFARGGEAIREYLAPAAHQFKSSPRANFIVNAAKVAYDSAANVAQQLAYGKVNLGEGKSIFLAALRNESDDVSVKKILDPLSEKHVGELHYLWKNRVDPSLYPALAAEGKIAEETVAAASQLNALDAKVWDSVNKAEVATGREPTKALAGHLGLSRSWEGDTRIVLRDESGKPVAMAGGVNRAGAQKNAKEMLANNPNWKLGEEFSLSSLSTIPKDLQPTVRSPSFVMERQGLDGFRWANQPFTKRELEETYSQSLHARFKYQANLSVEDQLSGHLDRLAVEDPATYRMVTARLNDYAGVKSAANKWQNQAVDKVLAPVLGTNSADKIVRTTNNLLWHLQLGGLKLSYPIANALTFLQTVLPEAVYVNSAPDERLAGKYSYFASGGTKGPNGGMGVLSPLKLMWDSMGEMRKPSKELQTNFARAVNERVIDPRVVEEYIGESAAKVSDWKKAISSGEGFVDWLRAVSEFLPANSERLSRGHAFTVGHMVGRDFLNLSDEQLYRFAKQFTENSMYLYSSADRPRLFTTPAGSTLGLFKNWMANYIASMLEYTGEGLANNNWAPLLWQTAGTFAVGGAAASPLYFVADHFAKEFADKSLLQLSYDNYGAGGDAMMFGLPAYLAGISLYSNVASPLSNPVRDASMIFGVAAWDRMKYVSNAFGAATDHWMATGENPGRDPTVRDLFARAFAPTTIYRTMGSMEESVIKSLSSGYPLSTTATGGQRLLYSLGLNPTELDRAMAVADELYTKKGETKAGVDRLGKAWAAAQMSGDSEQMALIMRQAMVTGIDVSSVVKSGMARIAKEKKAIIDRNFKPQDVSRYFNVLSGGQE